MKTRKYIQFPPEMADGQHFTVLNEGPSMGEVLKEWLNNHEVGEASTLRIVELTDDALENLPSI